MSKALTIAIPRQLAPILSNVPAVIAAAGDEASYRFVRYFVETIRNQDTRIAYARAVRDFLLWCEATGIALPSDRENRGSPFGSSFTRIPPSCTSRW